MALAGDAAFGDSRQCRLRGRRCYGCRVTRYFDFAAKTPVLVATFVGTLGLLALFQAIPVGGELLDVRQEYVHEEAMAALADYGADGRRVYAWSSATVDTVLPCVLVTLSGGPRL